jgi:hypothetical protein
MHALRSAALLAAIACLSTGPSAQGLADAARRASSAAQQPATKKYTNDDVDMAKPAAPAATPAATATDASKSEEGKTASEGSGASSEEAKAADAEPKKKPEYVLNRIPQLKAQLANKEKQLAELQASADTRGVALVKDQMALLQRELAVHEARVKPQD